MDLSVSWQRKSLGMVGCLLLVGSLPVLTGCGSFSQSEGEPRAQAAQTVADEPASVNVAVAREGTVEETREYTGTTQPFRLVSLRSQVDGQLLDLAVNVGDRVSQGQVLARVDGTVLNTNVAEAAAEVAARRSEVAQARAEVSDAQTQVNRAQADLQQAQTDFNRLQFLLSQGAIAAQEVDQARTQLSTARQAVQSAREQVRARQEAVVAAQERVAAQQAVVAREQERQSYAALTSPVTGSVVEQPAEVGNLIQPGTEVLKLGDFSRVKVVVQISERELGNLRPGQSVRVRLDAFPKQTFGGQITRISPAADPVARLVPIEVVIPNPEGRVGSGLLARVSLTQRTTRPRVLIPETALQTNEERQGGRSGNRSETRSQDRPGGQSGDSPRNTGTVFVVNEAGGQPTVTPRPVTLGNRNDGLVEVISGLQAGERFVARSSRALKNGDRVQLSVISEQAKE